MITTTPQRHIVLIFRLYLTDKNHLVAWITINSSYFRFQYVISSEFPGAFIQSMKQLKENSWNMLQGTMWKLIEEK